MDKQSKSNIIKDESPRSLARAARKRAAMSALRTARTPFLIIALFIFAALIGVPLILNGTVTAVGLPASAALAEPTMTLTPKPTLEQTAAPTAEATATPAPVIAEVTASPDVQFDTASYTDIAPGADMPIISKIQDKLMQLGYMESSEPTEHFGPATQEAVKRFQNSHYMTVTGVLDPLTQAVLFSDSAKLYVLNAGDKGDEVSQLQTRLADLSYYEDKENGYFGTATARALSAFQAKNGLIATGAADSETRALIYSPRAIPAVEPTPSPTPKPTKTPKPTNTPKPQSTSSYTPAPASTYYAEQTPYGWGNPNPDPDPYVPEPTVTPYIWETPAMPTFEPTAPPTQNPFDDDTPASADVSSFLAIARMQEGKPYIYSTEGPDSFDCSGFVYYSLRSVGVSVKRYSAAGFAEIGAWQTVSGKGNLAPGDLIFFRSDSSPTISHTGIWLGGNTYIHASSSAGKVVVSAWSDWSARNFVMGKRVF